LCRWGATTLSSRGGAKYIFAGGGAGLALIVMARGPSDSVGRATQVTSALCPRPITSTSWRVSDYVVSLFLNRCIARSSPVNANNFSAIPVSFVSYPAANIVELM
jgi:hypothetical protein